jgi:hypothetical protein
VHMDVVSIVSGILTADWVSTLGNNTFTDFGRTVSCWKHACFIWFLLQSRSYYRSLKKSLRSDRTAVVFIMF